MKTHLSNVLLILIVSVAVGVNGAPPVANSATETTARAFIPPPVGGEMNPGPVGGQMSPGVVGGTLSPGGFLGSLTPWATFVNGIPGGSLYFSPNGILHNPAPIGPPGGTWSGGGVGGVKSSVIIVTGGTATTGLGSGGILTTGGTGGSLSSGTVARSTSSVIVTGGSTN
jgi:hypothetical protein